MRVDVYTTIASSSSATAGSIARCPVPNVCVGRFTVKSDYMVLIPCKNRDPYGVSSLTEKRVPVSHDPFHMLCPCSRRNTYGCYYYEDLVPSAVIMIGGGGPLAVVGHSLLKVKDAFSIRQEIVNIISLWLLLAGTTDRVPLRRGCSREDMPPTMSVCVLSL